MTQDQTNLYSRRIDSLLTYNKSVLKLWKTLRHNSRTDYVVFIYIRRVFFINYMSYLWEVFSVYIERKVL